MDTFTATLGSSTAAATSATSAASSASAAASARAAAELARDSAVTTGKLYANTTAGLAAVAEGEYFGVPASGNDAAIVYQKSSGDAVEAFRFPSTARVLDLAAAVQSRAADTDGTMFYLADGIGSIVARITTDGSLHLAGMTESVQTKVAGIARPADASDSAWYLVTSTGSPVARIDSTGVMTLAGTTDSVQSAVRGSSHLTGVGPSKIALPPSFAPLQKPYHGNERYIWSSMPNTLRPNTTRLVSYAFDWSSEPVTPSMVRRATLPGAGAPGTGTWTYQALSVTLPPDWDTPYPRQFRDISWIYDRSRQKYVFAVNSIFTEANGWGTDRFSIFESTDGVNLTFVCYVPIPASGGLPIPSHVWSPEFFIDDDGTVYVIVSATEVASPLAPFSHTTHKFSYRLVRCDDTSTFGTWTYLGRLEGTAFPMDSGSYQMIDPVMFKRDGVYYVLWKSESDLVTRPYDYATLGWAAATSPLGPYNAGGPFQRPGGQPLLGEGQGLHELPPGSQKRFRITFDDCVPSYGALGGSFTMMCVETDDFVTVTDPRPVGLATYKRHSTFVLGT